MLYYKIIALTLAFVYLMVVFIYLARKKALIKGLLCSAASGLVLLAALKIASSYLSFFVPINTVSVVCAAAFGAPGVGFFFLIDYLFL